MPSIKDLVLIFSVADVRFAIEVMELLEVADGLVIKAGGGDGVLGSVRFREEEIPLLDMAARMQMRKSAGADGHMLVVKIGNRKAAFPVDAVYGVAGTRNALLPFPCWILKEDGIYSSVLDKEGEFVLLLDLGKLFDEGYFGLGDAWGEEA